MSEDTAARDSENGFGDHAAAGLEILPITGLPRFRKGDDLAAALVTAAAWLREDDILVVTSKIISKIEGRTVTAPTDPDARDAARRELVESEAIRVVARKGRTLITENRLGIVQAASGVDGSNVDGDELALLPVDPDASAAALRSELRDRLGVEVAVLITDTMGRAWRVGQTDQTIGASGIAVTHPYEGSTDEYGNPLIVTDIAVVDELAAAADLVKGKLGEIPVAVVRGLSPRENGTTARDLVRPGVEDLFWLGTTEAIDLGRHQGQLMRRSVRRFASARVSAGVMHEAFADALTAPAPHHSHPVRFVWLRDDTRRRRLLDAMSERWRADLVADGKTAESIDKRIARGQLLYDAPEVVIPFLTADGRHDYPDATRNAAEHTMFTVAAGAAVQGLLVSLAVRSVGSCWVGSTIFAPELVRGELDLPTAWEPLGAIAVGYPDSPDDGPRPPADIEGLVVEL